MNLKAYCKTLRPEQRSQSALRLKMLLIMKFTAVIIFAACLQVSASGIAQSITLKSRKATLQSIFKELEKQSGYQFFYNETMLLKAGTVTVDVKDMPLQAFLEQCFLNQPLTFAIVEKTLVIKEKEDSAASVEKSSVSNNQNTAFIVSGNVSSAADGNPLAGVSVMIKGTTTGVVTDASGKYALSIPSGNTIIIFSYTGYITQEVKAGNHTQINIQLAADVKQLGQIVVTAFGVERKKKALGYSAQVIDGKELTEARETNIVNSLKGKVAGVHVNPTTGGAGGSSFVMIRGNSSLSGNGQPLYVVDGVPIDNQTLDATRFYDRKDYGDGINNINPDDVENVTVLKGPAAASLYGARGANGVILITTKKGVKRKGVGINFNSNATMETPNVIPKFQTKWGGGYEDNYNSFSDVQINGQTYSQWPTWLNTEWGGKMDGRQLVFQAFPELGPITYTSQAEDNIKKFYQAGSTITNTIGASGGNESVSYRVSASDMHNTGIVPGNTLKRQTINLRISANLTSRLSIDGKINYIRQEGKNRPENNLSFTSPASNLNVLPRIVNLDWLKDYKRDDGSQINFKNGNPYNPYWILNELQNNDSRDRVIGFLSAKYTFTNWLTLQARSGTDFYTDTRFSRVGYGSPFESGGAVEDNQFHVKEENSDLLLSATGKLSRNFRGAISVGANHMNRRQELVGFRGSNLNIPGLYHISNAQLVIPRNELIRKQINSAYFAGQLEYRNFLFLDVTGRNDWSSTLGPDNLSFFYPSVSSSFVFSDAFKINQQVISFGKLRASYAEAGNDAIPYQTKSGYDVNSSTTFNGLPFANIRTAIPLLNLKNELTKTVELGTELRFFKNRLGIDFTYYSSSTINQILPVEISPTRGFTTRLINAGEIRNKGIELLLNGIPVKVGAFSWEVTINLSKNNSTVKSLAPGISAITLLDPDGVATIEARVGEPYGNIVGFPYMRTPTGEKLLNANGVWQRGADPVVLGNIQPDFLAGLTNTFIFKGFELSALIDVRKGGKVLSWTKYDQYRRGLSKLTENRDNMIAEGVIETSQGKFEKSDKVLLAQDYYGQRGYGNIGEEFVIDADYVALREATIGYTIGSALFRKSFLRNAKLSIIGRNLLYLYRDPQFKTMGISPERALNTAAASQGFETRGIPTVKSIGANLSFSF
ncbi:MAG: SusC/RagA family TonB-linked outer membrane protein [Flavitalea sp.]